MYTRRNFKSKAALKRAMVAGDEIKVFQPGGIFVGATEGHITLEGPHFPDAHTWYARCKIKDSVIVKGTLK